MVWLTIILSLVMFIGVSVYTSSSNGTLPSDSVVLETTWTVLPIIILLTIAFPSIHLLCLQDSLGLSPTFTTNVISNQWNWQSSAVDDSWDHLLDVDTVDNTGSYEVPLLVNSFSLTRLIITSTDVLHSLGIPSLGIKLDSMPGRINATTVDVSSPGLFTGSCYELCGSGHSVIPIYMLSV